MNLPIFIFSLLICLFSIFNYILNGRFKYWEILSIIPVSIPIAVCKILLILNLILIRDLFSIVLNLISLAFFLPFLDFSLLKSNKNSSGNKIKIIDLNTLFFYPNNHSELADFLSRNNPDIIVIQELFKTKNTNAALNMKSAIPTKFLEPDGYLESDFIKPLFPNYNNIVTAMDRGIVSKYPVEIYKEFASNDKFGYMISKLNIDSDELFLINVHMPFRFDKTFGYDERREAFNELYTDINSLKKKNIIITGDFNQTKSSRFILKLFDMLNEAITQNNIGLFASWHPKLPLWRLDYMFYSGNITFSKAKLFKNKFSDHKGIEGEFEIR